MKCALTKLNGYTGSVKVVTLSNVCMRFSPVCPRLNRAPLPVALSRWTGGHAPLVTPDSTYQRWLYQQRPIRDPCWKTNPSVAGKRDKRREREFTFGVIYWKTVRKPLYQCQSWNREVSNVALKCLIKKSHFAIITFRLFSFLYKHNDKRAELASHMTWWLWRSHQYRDEIQRPWCSNRHTHTQS